MPTVARSRPRERTHQDPVVRRWIARHLARAALRAPSLVITVWGDALAPHGGAVLLPGLIRLLAPFGCNERLVRTSVFRLVRQGWLAAKPVGRRSLYALTVDGARQFAAAHARIYAVTDEPWNDTWELVLADGFAPGERRRLADELHWAGFGNFGAGVYGRPARSLGVASAIVQALGFGDRAIVVLAIDGAEGTATLAAAVPRAWDLAAIAARYRELLRRFGGLGDRFRGREDGTLDPEQCFVVRTLLIHAYRRALLRDPRLPAALLPLDWPGAAAHALCRDLYRLTYRAAERHVMATAQRETGPLPRVGADFHRRFGGLDDPRAGDEAKARPAR